MRARWVLVAPVAFGASALYAFEARADDEDVAIELHYRASARCPDETAFFAELRAGAPRIRRAVSGEAAYAATIAVSEEHGASEGEVELRDVNGRVARRHLEGGDCVDVARALALVIALDAVGAATVPPRAPTPRDPAPEPSSPAPPVPDAPIRRAPWSPMAMVLAGIRSGIAPSLAAGGTLALGVEREAAPSWLSSAFLLRASYATTDAAGAGDTVAFRLVSASLDACVSRVPLGARVLLMPCARLEGGYHFADIRPGGAGTAGTALVALGLVAWLRVRIAGGVFVTTEAVAELPMTRARFFEGDARSPVFVSPLVSGALVFGTGVTFP